jgi:hypothetical protein
MQGDHIRVPFILYIDDFTDYIVGYRLINRSTSNMIDAMSKMIGFYNQFDWDVQEILVDREAGLIAKIK